MTTQHCEAKVLAHARKLSAGYPGRRVLDQIDLDIEAGVVHGLIGPNGAGKSTLVKTLLGLIPALSGTVLLAGRELSSLKSHERAVRAAYLAQDIPSDIILTAREVVQLGRYVHELRHGLDEDSSVVEEALTATGALPWAERPMRELSGGERQLVALARVLAQEAPFIVLDEPISALDLGHELMVLDLLRPWVDGRIMPREDHRDGRGVLMVIHDVNLAARFCDRITLIVGKKVLADGPPEAVLTADLVRKAYSVDVDVSLSPVTGKPVVTSIRALSTTERNG